MRIEGLKKLNQTLRKLQTAYGSSTKVSVAVGYTVAYAVYVHENTQMKWKGLPRRPPAHGVYWEVGQPKFLEEPARTMQSELKAQVVRTLENGIAHGKKVSLVQALVLAGNRLMAASQKLAPVETGDLKGSAKVYKEKF